MSDEDSTKLHCALKTQGFLPKIKSLCTFHQPQSSLKSFSGEFFQVPFKGAMKQEQIQAFCVEIILDPRKCQTRL